MERSMLTEVKAILKSLVLSSPEKITVERLNHDYRDMEGQLIPFRQLGYGNLEQFLHSIPDTLKVFGSGPTAMVCFVANEKSEHIHKMIMKQKKPKSKSRSTSKSAGSNRNNAVPGKNFVKLGKVSGQQLSPFHSINRNQTAKTLQVKPLPQPFNYVPNQLYDFPQPNGISLTPTICTVQNGIIKSINVKGQHCQNKITQLNNSLRNQCHISNPPASLQYPQNRNTSRPAEKPPIQVKVEAEKRSQNEKLISNKVSPEAKRNTSPIHIEPPATRKQFCITIPDEADEMPSLSKSSNDIKEQETDESTQGLKEDDKTRNSCPVQPKRCFDISSDSTEDLDEAIPSFAAKNNVFRLDFPECTVKYGAKIPRFKLPSEIAVGICLKIFISEIHSPFKFWFHIYKEDHELDKLMYQIECFYSNLNAEDLRIPVMCLTPGQVCAASYNGFWHRAEIVAPPVNKSVKVSFMDYGTVTEVEIENVKFLPTFFAELPVQALRGCLSHIKPLEYHWSHKATKHFLGLVAELMLYAEITEIDQENDVLYMILCNTNSDKVIQVNSNLVEQHHAVFNDDWKAENIRKNNGKRRRHPREDFPTFSMIEMGEYPSFQELVSLQKRGIDYDMIYDIVIFNQSSILINKPKCASQGLRSLPYFLTTSNPFRSEILLELNTSTPKATRTGNEFACSAEC